MENWYVPITIVPAIGLLILSTSNLLVALSNEIKNLLDSEVNREELMSRKLSQLKVLSNVMVALYISVACFVISGLLAGLFQSIGRTFDGALYISIGGILCALFGLGALIMYSFRAVKIRQDQFHKTC